MRAPGLNAAPSPSAAPPADFVLAVGGGLLLLASVGWLGLTAEAQGGDARAAAAALLLAALAFLAARWTTRRVAWLAPLLLVASAAAVAAMHFDTLLAGPLGNPLGYSNATASFYMLAAGGALMLLARRRAPQLRVLAALAYLGCALVPWLNGCHTAAALVALLPLGLLARSTRGVRLAVAGGGGVLVVVLAGTVVLGATYTPGERGGAVDRLVDATLSERRPQLWHDALRLMAREPLTGVGPSRFPEESPTARMDRDTRWPHNELLHFGAEAGVPGLLLLLGLGGWGFARLWWGGDDAATAVAALSVGALGVHASVDYVLHFPAVLAAGAVLLGAGSCVPRRARDRARQTEGTRSHGPAEPEFDLSFLDELERRGASRR